MTQNTEQNAFRSREAQEDSLTYHLGGLQAARNFRLLARAMIDEAEARGAEEQRRKDAESIITYEEARRRKCEHGITPVFMGKMMHISKLISWLQDVHKNFGDTIVYARCLSWGSVAFIQERRDREVLSADKRSAWTDSSPLDVGTNALQDVISERERQKSVEGWTEAHDDAYDLGEMASAASAYAYSASATPSEANILSAVPPVLWPWAREWWKPTTARRDLVKAAALILAEIERLDRATVTREGTE